MPTDIVSVTLADGSLLLINTADTHLLGKYTWRLRGDAKHGRYVARRTWSEGRINQITILLHRLILDAPPGTYVDHADGDPLNNTRDNLRIVSHKQNCWNRMRTDAAAGYKGVTRRGASGKYRAAINKDGIRFNLGCFVSAEGAARAYNVAATEMFGEYARLNVIPDEQEAAA
jgi:hypothetical protein